MYRIIWLGLGIGVGMLVIRFRTICNKMDIALDRLIQCTLKLDKLISQKK